MKHTNLAAILMVAVMTLSVCAVAGVTTSTRVEAAVNTVTSLTIGGGSGKMPVDQNYGVLGHVKTTAGAPVPSGKVYIYRQVSGGGAMKLWKIAPITNGQYEKGYFYALDMQTKPCVVHYMAKYTGWPIGGEQQYLSSSSPSRSAALKYLTGVKYQATALPGVLSGYKVSGKLYYWQNPWKPFANQLVYVYKKNVQTLTWKQLGNPVQTDANGKWTVTDSRERLATSYSAEYKGDATHWSSHRLTITGYGVD